MKKTLKRGLAALMTVVLLVSMIVVVPAVAAPAANLKTVIVNYPENLAVTNDTDTPFSSADDLGNSVESSSGQIKFTNSGDHVSIISFRLNTTSLSESVKDNGDTRPLTNKHYEMAKLEDSGATTYYFSFDDLLLSSTISNEVTITITKSYTVSFSCDNASRYSLTATDGGTNLKTNPVVSITQNTFSFTLTMIGDYANSYMPSVYVNGTKKENPHSVDGKTYNFELTGISSDTEVSVNVEPITFEITSDDLGQLHPSFETTFQSGTKVNYDGSYSFTVSPNDGYDAPEVTIDENTKGKGNLAKAGTNYTISNVTDNVKVKFTPKAIKQYDVTFQTNDTVYKITESSSEVAIESPQKVDHGSSLSFKVKLNEKYNKSNITVSANGVTLIPTAEGVYTITNVTAPTTVAVAGYTPNNYKVTIPSGKGYTVNTNEVTVEHGSNATFTVTVSDGYDVDQLNVTADGPSVEKKRIDGTNQFTVTVKNVTKDVSVSIESTEVKYTVSSDISNESNHATVNVTDGNNIKYGGNVTFTVKADNGYKVTRVYATTTDGVPITSNLTTDSSKTYHLTAITDNAKIVVETAKVTVTVVYHNTTGPNSDTTRNVTYQIKGEEENVDLDSKTNETIFTSDYYDAVGYSLDTNVPSTDKLGSENLNIAYGNDDITRDIYISWYVNPGKLYKATIDGTTGASYLDLLSQYVAQANNVVDELNREAGAGAQIVKFGFLLSNQNIDTSGLTARDIKEGSGETIDKFEEQKVYAYFNKYEANPDPSGSIHVRFTKLKGNIKRTACAFVIIKSHDNYYLICSDCGEWTINN